MNTPMIAQRFPSCLLKPGAVIAGLILIALTASAGLPQPMCVYYGQALDGYGWPYTTNAQVLLLHGTDEIAQHTVAGSISPGVNFALYVHLDSGTSSTDYSPRALRSGDLVSIVVRDQMGETSIIEDLQVPPVGEPGELIMIDVTAGEDVDGDSLSDQWEQELVNWSFGALNSILDVHPWDDYDGDGQSNGDEYGAGTFAFLDYDKFFAEDYGRTTNGRFRITFLSVAGKLYGARYVTALNHSLWVPSALAGSETGEFQTTPIEGTGDWISMYLPGGISSSFFRPTVENSTSYLASATSTVSSLVALDDADNDPYPASQFQIGDNGGVNFEPWAKLESDTLFGSRFLAATIGNSLYSWGLSGTYGVGRALPGIAHHGLWAVWMVHDPDNTGFSGFNLKTAALPGFGASEIIRVGMAADQLGFNDSGVYFSMDGGASYSFLDCGWVDGRGDVIIYQIVWNETGTYDLTVENVDEGITTVFEGTLPTSSVVMMGMAVFGNTLDESVQFDGLAFFTDPVLTIRRAEAEVIISWPSGFVGYTLQSNPDLLQTTGWSPVGEAVVSAEGVSEVSVPITSSQQYFRLTK